MDCLEEKTNKKTRRIITSYGASSIENYCIQKTYAVCVLYLFYNARVKTIDAKKDDECQFKSRFTSVWKTTFKPNKLSGIAYQRPAFFSINIGFGLSAFSIVRIKAQQHRTRIGKPKFIFEAIGIVPFYMSNIGECSGRNC